MKDTAITMESDINCSAPDYGRTRSTDLLKYQAAANSVVTAHYPEFDEIGIGFDMTDGTITRLKLNLANARTLANWLAVALPASGSGPVGQHCSGHEVEACRATFGEQLSGVCRTCPS